VFLENVSRPFDAVGPAHFLVKGPVKVRCKQLENALVVRVPGSETSDDECVHGDNPDWSSPQHSLHVLLLLELPGPQSGYSIFKRYSDVYYIRVGVLLENQVWSLSFSCSIFQGWFDSNTVAHIQFLTLDRCFNLPEVVVMSLGDVCHCRFFSA